MKTNISSVLSSLGISSTNNGSSTGLSSYGAGEKINSYSPVDGKLIASVTSTTKEEYESVLNEAENSFGFWRSIPAPKRGEIVRQYGEKLRKNKQDLGQLVSYEMGK